MRLLSAMTGSLGKHVERMRAQQQVLQQHQFLQNVLDSLAHPLLRYQRCGPYHRSGQSGSVTANHLQRKLTCYALPHGRDQPCEDADHPCPLQEIERTKEPR